MDAPWVGVLRDCNVRYRGRARANQEGGTLAVLLKEDGTLLAHALDSGVKPQFYNPAGDTRWWTRLDRLYIRSESAGGEVLKINGVPEFVREVAEHERRENPPRRYMAGLENDLADWIAGNLELVGLGGGDVERQADRSGGRVDLLVEGGVVVEVKRRATVSAHDQAQRYLRDPEVREVVVACLHASENLLRVCRNRGDVRVVVLDADEFENWLDERA